MNVPLRLIPKNLSLLQRFVEVLTQDVNSVLHRSGGTVSKYLLSEYFVSENFLQFRAFERCLDFAELVYIDDLNAEDTALVEKRRERLCGWQEWHEFDDAPHRPASGFNVPGLRYQVWYKAATSTAVIAFRGTRITHAGDWYANLHWITRFIPGVNDAYRQTHAIVPALTKHLEEQFGEDITVIATGHSLGGGLAQHAAYSSDRIRLVHAFAPTPVTGYSSIVRSLRERNKRNTLIIRAFEHGEILAYLRFFLRRLVRLSISDPEIFELRFNCSNNLPISEHDMVNMAENLRSKISGDTTGGRFAAGAQPQ